MREMMREALEFHLEGMAEDGVPMPTPVTVSLDFKEMDEIEEGAADHYVIEWMEIEVPVFKQRNEVLTA